jgi:hypothetical protein
MLRLRGARGWTLSRIEYSSGYRDSLCAFRGRAAVTSLSFCISTVVRDMPCQSGIFCVVKLACRVAELRLPSPAAPEQRKQRNPLSCSTRQRLDYEDNLNAMRLRSWSVYGNSSCFERVSACQIRTASLWLTKCFWLKCLWSCPNSCT